MIESTNFSAAELSCRCGCGLDAVTAGVVTERRYLEWLTMLEAIRRDYGHPMTVTSAYRCPAHNRRVGGASGSQHTVGIAVDVLVPDAIHGAKLVQAARAHGVRCVGVGTGFVHLDWRTDADRLWGY